MNLDDLIQTLEGSYLDLVPELTDRARELAEFTATKAQELLALAGDPDFNAAFEAARDQVLLHAAVALVQTADAADEANHRVASAILRFAVGALAAA